ncbi:site-specific DNA-methyltransferase [Acinetobacter baumannii]|uniref:site-specific DNA-methyltransferase n=1 Tax=Acinetobacter baumannii TaxID=470 RepID=UPI0023427A04|nr:site-specific DNA-methyltransferase [Acinetobacter baumannii]MCZ3316178.1 site-specific DNA-methyltransferase [Acinetobacter baumannii]MDC4723627.1 site-specific DNA-methyltransferase [Acinetobacter baumannii]MDC5628734.1 site-specific DNA-methyltransferase [Acinetobacter baumannii]MDH2498829.1 site-specific DNA-methyltransferase [Acinetobacter baumannii]MDV7470761.1 site-specific DNA-methyltransferase [Acinetobacter baumannii]
MPEFEGKVNCIYIDPPYNTGNEGWVYNDNVNDPRIIKWLGDVVGKEGEDLSRHDKWLCMMYPRLKLLHRLLADDGAIFVSIDDIEHSHLCLIMDEIFGIHNRVANFVWQSKDTPGNNSSGIAETHNHLLMYRKSSLFKTNLLSRNSKQLENYANPDNDYRGDWLSTPLTRAEHRDRDYYSILNKAGIPVFPPQGSSWRRPPHEMKRLEKEDRIWWGKAGNSNFPMEKKFLSEVKDGVVNQTWWPYQFAGSTRNASAEMKHIFNGVKEFDTPKPVQLIERILRIATNKNSIILDSFAGSGTTAHAVLKLNTEDGGSRRFILCEMMDYAESITAERVRRVMEGYGEGNKKVEGLGGSFDFYELGDALFSESGLLNESVGIKRIRQYIGYSESIPLDNQLPIENEISPSALGLNQQTLWLFHYNKHAITSLDLDFLGTLNLQNIPRPSQFVVYADKCVLDDKFMQKHGITFKRIPRDIMRF